jgi:putative membrane protein
MSEVELAEAGTMRTVYLVILLSHIVLAAVSLPFILLTFCYGFTNHFTKHKKLSRKIFPVWLYVAVTGPVVYLLLSPYY